MHAFARVTVCVCVCVCGGGTIKRGGEGASAPNAHPVGTPLRM